MLQGVRGNDGRIGTSSQGIGQEQTKQARRQGIGQTKQGAISAKPVRAAPTLPRLLSLSSLSIWSHIQTFRPSDIWPFTRKRCVISTAWEVTNPQHSANTILQNFYRTYERQRQLFHASSYLSMTGAFRRADTYDCQLSSCISSPRLSVEFS